MTLEAVDGEMVILAGEKTFDVRDFGLEPPRILMLKVEPDVTVKVAIVAEKVETPPSGRPRSEGGGLTCTSSGCAPRSSTPSSSAPATGPWPGARPGRPAPPRPPGGLRPVVRGRGVGTVAEDAAAELVLLPVSVRCASCGAVTVGDEMPLACPECSGVDLEVVGGDELVLESIEYRAPLSVEG